MRFTANYAGIRYHINIFFVSQTFTCREIPIFGNKFLKKMIMKRYRILIVVLIAIISFNKWIWGCLNYWSKIPCVSPTISEILSSTFIETLWPAHAETFSKDRQI